MSATTVIRLGVLLLALALLCAKFVKTSQPSTDLATLQSVRIQDANLYLINLGLELDGRLGEQQATGAARVSDGQISQLRQILRRFLDASDELNLMRQGILDESDLEEKYKPLLTGTDKETLSEFLANLSRSLDNCDQDGIDFFLLISNYRRRATETTNAAALHDRQLLVQNYAKLRVELCWQRFVASISHIIDIQVGKMSVPLFKYIEQVATNMKCRPEEAETKSGKPKTSAARAGRQPPGSIKIDDTKSTQEAANKNDMRKLFDPDSTTTSLDSTDDDKLKATIEALERISFGTAKGRLEFVLGVNHMYKAYAEFVANNGDEDGRYVFKNQATVKKEVQEFYEKIIERPCAELLERMASALRGGQIFRGHIDQTLANYLAKEKQNNLTLSYELQMYRICKKSKADREQILSLLFDLNKSH